MCHDSPVFAKDVALNGTQTPEHISAGCGDLGVMEVPE
jgi:hypothetical protein